MSISGHVCKRRGAASQVVDDVRVAPGHHSKAGGIGEAAGEAVLRIGAAVVEDFDGVHCSRLSQTFQSEGLRAGIAPVIEVPPEWMRQNDGSTTILHLPLQLPNTAASRMVVEPEDKRVSEIRVDLCRGEHLKVRGAVLLHVGRRPHPVVLSNRYA